MSTSLPQRKAWRSASPVHSMGTKNLDQSNLSSGAPHGGRPTTRSQAPLATTAGSVDRTPIEFHQGPEYHTTHGHNNAPRAEMQGRREEEKHGDNYNTSSSRRAARDQRSQEDVVRAPDQDKPYHTPDGSSRRAARDQRSQEDVVRAPDRYKPYHIPDGTRNLQHEQSGPILQDVHKDRDQSKREASETKQRTPVAAPGERVPESSSAQLGVLTRFFTRNTHDPSTGYADAELRSLMKQYEDTLKEGQKLKQELHNVRTTAQRNSRLWESEYRKMVNRINELESQLEKERLEKIQHQRRVDKIAAHIDNQEFFIGIQMSDSGILGLWHSLWVQVKGWSVAFSSEHPIDKRFLEEQEVWVKMLRTIAPGDAKLRRLDQRKTRRESVQAIVGYTLAEDIFRRLSNDESSPLEAGTLTPYKPVLDHWTPEHNEAIDNIERALSQATQSTINVRELNDWRAFTVSLVSRMHPASKMQEQTSIMARFYAFELMEMISGWAKPSETREALELGIAAILQKALEFAMEMRKQRASWSVELPCRSTEFNNELMDDVDADADEEDHMERVVEVYLFPGLYKQGNADGEHFDVKRCFVKGKVKCTAKG